AGSGWRRGRRMPILRCALLDRRGAWLFFLPVSGRLRQILLHSKLYDPADQVVGNRLIEWESQVALFPCIGRCLSLQGFVAPDRRIKAYVVLESGKINQIAF